MKKLFNYLLIASVVIMAACNAEDVINESPVNKNGDDVLLHLQELLPILFLALTPKAIYI